jgi:hypothetical protein
MIKESIMCLLVLVTAFGCSGSIPEPTSRHVEHASQQWPGVNKESLMEGRKLYISSCSGCHSLISPSQFTVSQWDTILISMKPHAKLTIKEYEIIRMYVLAMSNK